jgi:predicted secreted hydrolase
VRVPSAAIDVTLEPLVLDQELAGASSPSYWEGAVDVRDARKDVSIGAGYVELTGYAGPVSI